MNLISKICEMLGIEIDEEFKISQGGEMLDNGALYKFNGTWFFKHNNIDDNWDVCSDSTLLLLLNGHIDIVKLPFEPKDDEMYWYVWWNGGNIDTSYTFWSSIVNNWSDKYCGNCFRTQPEAEKHKYEIYEKLTGKKWEDAV